MSFNVGAARQAAHAAQRHLAAECPRDEQLVKRLVAN